ncbi:MAG: carboxypeptidase regulatory-like domain-containing protein [Gemmatimonadota bacterium]|nr:carboxypeptidase regulatory-like domain-containing protein [Gemmatimonadota bacterium]
MHHRLRSSQSLRSLATALLSFTLAASLFSSAVYAQQRGSTGAIAGVVVDDNDRPLSGAAIRVARSDGSASTDAVSNEAGVFAVPSLAPGLYRVTARRIGFREARLPFLRIVSGQTSAIRVSLSASATQLSTVTVPVTATSIDASTTGLARRITVDDVKLVPLARDAASLVDLVPGARKGFVWGGAGDAANNYQLDGVSVNHPGVGGDFLAPSIDWIEALEVRGLGAGAEYGSFQGGILNAVTKTGTNDFLGALRVNYVSPSLTSTNLRPNEEGIEQTRRGELSGEIRGPIFRDRLFYFIGGQVVDRSVRVPDLTTLAESDIRTDRQELRDSRGIAKITLLPGLRDRIDLLGGYSSNDTDRAELNGINDARSARRVDASATYYSLGWTRTNTASLLDVRVAGFNARETRRGYGADAPAVQVFSVGRQPVFQNSVFNERLEPRSVSGNATFKTQHSLLGGENRIVLGADYTRGWWRNERVRNGGLTWFPYPDVTTQTIDVTRPAMWPDVASEWGGEIRLQSDIEEGAVFLQDYFSPGPTLTFTPGLRYSGWAGWLTPSDSAGVRFLAARHQAFDPRFGVVWDVSETNTFVLKAHWGRYHQGLSSLFFDRAQGADVYSNHRFYFQGPDLTDSRTVFTATERDAMLNAFTGFSPTFVESILNEAGRVENYRQPFVDQVTLGVEKTFGSRWKAELAYTNRINKDVAGLVDKNLASNYSALTDVRVRQRVSFGPVYDQTGDNLVLPVLWVSNFDLRRELIRRRDNRTPLPPVPGYTFADIDRLSFDRDIVLSTVDAARRRFDQLSLSLRTEQPQWNALVSVTATRLVGNVPGLTGFGSNGTNFTAGPGVRPNETLRYEGELPNFPALESKLWLSGQLPYGLQGGVFTAFSLGEYFTPVFQLNPRFRLQASDGSLLPDDLVDGVRGQSILLEDRGSRKYQGRTNLDVRLERRFQIREFAWFVTADLFNALGSDAIVERNLTINDQISTDPTSTFAAPRQRVTPRALQVGGRIEM